MLVVLVCSYWQSVGTSCIPKFKKPEQNLIDVPPSPVVKTNTEPKRDIFEML